MNRETNVRLYSFGAVQEVTGSKHILEVNGKKILIDCGMFQGRREETYRRNKTLPFKAEEIDVVFLTHAHFDHSGNLPSLIIDGYDKDIYATPATFDLTSLILNDSAYIQKRDTEFIRKIIKKRKRTDLKIYEPIYGIDDVKNTLSNFVLVDYNKRIKVFDNVEAEFYDAGHILGSAMIVFFVKMDEFKTLKIGFSGDLGRKNQVILKDPQKLPDLDYFILESTYGNRLHDNITKTKDELAEVINSTYKKKGKIIIPAFAVERTQEIIYYIHELIETKKIPSLPIYVDSPMAVHATSVFKTHPECFDRETFELFYDKEVSPFDFEGVNYIVDVERSKKLNSLREPAIIIAASGMCEHGRIVHHLRNNIEKPENTILIVGFMAQHTLGRKIADREKEVKIFGEKLKVNARVKILNTFSAHADYNEMKEYVKQFNLEKLKKIFLVHGEPDAQKYLEQVLERNGVKEVKRVFNNEKYKLV
jgi:metallo-beta-lactamase family protein